MKHPFTFVCAVVIFIGMLGCDDKSSLPQSVQDAATKAQSDENQGPKRPTTQQLLTGPKKRIVLTPLPFSVQVPTSWKIENLSNANQSFLSGPTPSAEVQIQLSSRVPAKKEDLEIIQRAAKRELASTQPGIKKVIKADFRKIGDVEVFERQAVGQPGPLIVTDEKGTEHTVTATPMDWKVTLFVPQGAEGYSQYELNFIALTAEQYKQDKPLLDAIINSISVDMSGTPSSGTGATTKPI